MKMVKDNCSNTVIPTVTYCKQRDRNSGILMYHNMATVGKVLALTAVFTTHSLVLSSALVKVLTFQSCSNVAIVTISLQWETVVRELY